MLIIVVGTYINGCAVLDQLYYFHSMYHCSPGDCWRSIPLLNKDSELHTLHSVSSVLCLTPTNNILPRILPIRNEQHFSTSNNHAFSANIYYKWVYVNDLQLTSEKIIRLGYIVRSTILIRFRWVLGKNFQIKNNATVNLSRLQCF